jgi:hypothetical protein
MTTTSLQASQTAQTTKMVETITVELQEKVLAMAKEFITLEKVSLDFAV